MEFVLFFMTILPTIVKADDEGSAPRMDRGSFFIAFFIGAIPFTIMGLFTYYTHTIQVIARWKFTSILKAAGEVVHAKVLDSSTHQFTTGTGPRQTYTLLVEYDTNQILADKTNESPLTISTKVKVKREEFQSSTESGTIGVVVYPGYPEYAMTHQQVFQPVPTNFERRCAMVFSLFLPVPFSITGIVACIMCYTETDDLQKYAVGLFLLVAIVGYVGITFFVLFTSYPYSVMKDDDLSQKSSKWFSSHKLGGSVV